LTQRLAHERWQVRREAYVEIAASLKTDNRSQLKDPPLVDTLPPELWPQCMKLILNENNIFALQEGLKAIDAFVSSKNFPQGSWTGFLRDLIEKSGLFKQQM